MNTIKELYSSPTTKILVVRFEEGILTVSGGVNWSNTSGGAGGDDNYDPNDGEGF